MKAKKFTFQLLFVFFFTAISYRAFSQISVYKPFPSYGMWNVETDGPYDPSGGSSIPDYTFQKYESNGDTIIGSYTYKKVSLSEVTYTGPPPLPPYSPWAFSFAYRNDVPAKKVYIYANIPEYTVSGTTIPAHYQDTLWYDFNLNIGDTLKRTFAFAANDSAYLYDRRIVTSIDSISLCGVYHKRFNFMCDDYSTLLIEGAGFTDHFLHTTPMCPFEPVYISTTQFSCTLTSINDLPAVNKTDLFPNPATTTVHISDAENIVLPFEYSIVNCLGQVTARGIATDYNGIDISALKNGLYFLMLQDKQQNRYESRFLKQ